MFHLLPPPPTLIAEEPMKNGITGFFGGARWQVGQFSQLYKRVRAVDGSHLNQE